MFTCLNLSEQFEVADYGPPHLPAEVAVVSLTQFSVPS